MFNSSEEDKSDKFSKKKKDKSDNQNSFFLTLHVKIVYANRESPT